MGYVIGSVFFFFFLGPIFKTLCFSTQLVLRIIFNLLCLLAKISLKIANTKIVCIGSKFFTFIFFPPL